MYHARVMNALEIYHRCNILTERSPMSNIYWKSKYLSRKVKENILRCHNLYLKCIMNVSWMNHACIMYYCLSTRTIWAILQFDWFPRPILSANITFPQCYGTLSRQVTVKVRSNLQSWFENFLLTRFACFQAIISCRSNADVPTRLNVHVRSVWQENIETYQNSSK